MLARRRRQLSRAFDYVRSVGHEIHPRYVLVHGLVHLLPAFSAGPIVARMYRFAGFSIGDACSIGGPLRVRIGSGSAANLTLGRNVIISSDVTINVDEAVDIGDHASIGPFVRIYTSTHPIGPGSRRMMLQMIGKPVRIGRGAWVGLGATILPGVTVGDGAIVAAGSVVATDVEPHGYVEGNPATMVRSLPWADR